MFRDGHVGDTVGLLFIICVGTAGFLLQVNQFLVAH